MNFTELARRIKMNPNELREILPQLGFDIGHRAIKVDDRIANNIIKNWQKLKEEYTKKQQMYYKKKDVEREVDVEKKKKQVKIPQLLTVKDLAILLEIPVTRLIEELMRNGIIINMNEKIDFETAAIVSEDLGFEVVKEDMDDFSNKEASIDQISEFIKEQDESKLVERPPVVVVLGHVDHGKTKLLDTIRKTDVVAEESGGITQHIGAYQVKRKGRLITFIDTPGHEAFTTMRSRGARVADIAILVIAADDGVKPQTVEAIKIIRGAKLPMIVAINKIDKQESNIEKVKKELSEHNLVPEDWGGKTICVPVSAKEGTGIDDLLDMIGLVTDMEKESIRANPNTSAVGTVIESHIDTGEGPVATVLVQVGTLRINDYLGIGNVLYGKVRCIKDWRGENIDKATPGTPVKILGFRIAPAVGDIVAATKDKKSLQKKIKFHEVIRSQVDTSITRQKVNKKKASIYNIILKADVVGSLEAIILSLEKLSHPEVEVNIIKKGLGSITEADVLNAEATGAVIMGFHVNPTTSAKELAKEKHIKMKTYKVIYDLIDDVKSKLEAFLEPELVVQELGQIQVLAIFRKEKNSMIVGGKVITGKVMNSAKVRVMRHGEEIAVGQIIELQEGKESVSEVLEGSKCGIKFQGEPVIVENDVLEVYIEEKKEKKL